MNNIYIKVFTDENKAWDWMVMKNKACKMANNFKDVFCTIEHPEGFAVVDITTAIDIGSPYSWSYI